MSAIHFKTFQMNLLLKGNLLSYSRMNRITRVKCFDKIGSYFFDSWTRYVHVCVYTVYIIITYKENITLVFITNIWLKRVCELNAYLFRFVFIIHYYYYDYQKPIMQVKNQLWIAYKASIHILGGGGWGRYVSLHIPAN